MFLDFLKRSLEQYQSAKGVVQPPRSETLTICFFHLDGF